MVVSLLVLIVKSPELILSSMIQSSQNVVSLCINLLAIYAVWLGILEIVEKTGISQKIARLLSPIIKKIFKITNKEQIEYISINLSANLLGLGNAATPSGIKAIKSMDKDLPKTRFAMMMLLVINATGLQLFPTTIIGLRISANSLSPSDIIFPIILSSLISMFAALSLMFLYNKIKKRKQ